MKTYTTTINNRFYAFGEVEWNGETKAVGIGKDRPDGYNWFVAELDKNGVYGVSKPSASKAYAVAKAKRAGEYCGHVELPGIRKPYDNTVHREFVSGWRLK